MAFVHVLFSFFAKYEACVLAQPSQCPSTSGLCLTGIFWAFLHCRFFGTGLAAGQPVSTEQGFMGRDAGVLRGGGSGLTLQRLDQPSGVTRTQKGKTFPLALYAENFSIVNIVQKGPKMTF